MDSTRRSRWLPSGRTGMSFSFRLSSPVGCREAAATDVEAAVNLPIATVPPHNPRTTDIPVRPVHHPYDGHSCPSGAPNRTTDIPVRPIHQTVRRTFLTRTTTVSSKPFQLIFESSEAAKTRRFSGFLTDRNVRPTFLSYASFLSVRSTKPYNRHT